VHHAGAEQVSGVRTEVLLTSHAGSTIEITKDKEEYRQGKVMQIRDFVPEYHGDQISTVQQLAAPDT
jgi:hypothetical protein